MARIINYTEATGLSEGDYIIIDNENGATKKLSLTNLIIKALNQEGKIPDAKTVGDAIAAVRAIAEANAEEIAGAKIGTDGTEYYSIGEHITMSVGALQTLINGVSEECPNVLDYALLPSGTVRGVTITKSEDVLTFTGTADSSSEDVSCTIPLTAETQYTAKIYSDSDKLINVEFRFTGDTPTRRPIGALNTPLTFVVPRNTTLVSMSISPVSGNVYSGDTYRISINKGDTNDYYIQYFSGITVVDRVARQNLSDHGSALSDIKGELADGRSNTDGFVFNSIGDHIRNVMTSAKNEIAALESQLKEMEEALENVAIDPDDLGLYYDENTSYLYPTYRDTVSANGIFAQFGGGGGGGGGDTIDAELTVTNTTGWLSKTVSIGASCAVSFHWTSIEDGMSTGDGTITVTVNGITKLTRQISQGDVTTDISSYLSAGTNKVKVRIADAYDQGKTTTFTITCVAMTIESSFDTSIVYSAPFSFPFTPTGSVEKTVYFYLDGNLLGTMMTSVSGRQLSYAIPSQTHGAHSLRVYFTAEVNGETVSSNELYYEFIYAVSGNTTTIITSPFNETQFQQYASIVIPYTVYDPSNLTAEVKIYANGTLVSTQTVDRTQQSYTYRAVNTGVLTISMVSNGTTKSFNLTIGESDIDVEPITQDLALYLSSYGRSNAEENPAVWKYNNIACTFSGFNWTSDGWQTDKDGISILRVSGDARLTIPYKPFASDFRTTGKTIELEFATRNVLNYDATILSCMSGNRGLSVTAQKATLKSEQSEISTQYKEDEHVRIAFVAEKRAEHRLLYIYINGIASGVVQYPTDDDFSQVSPVNISVGSSDCTIDLYCIRVYDNDLTRHQVVENWIADTQIGTLMLERYNRNNVFDAYGNIVIAQLPSDLPYMIISCAELPQSKGDKKTCSGSFVNPINTAKNFTFENCQIDVQGTSSQYYARKNYKMKFNNGFVMDSGTESKYAMAVDSIPVKTFCMKADYASSEGANNVELVRLYEQACPYNTPAQVANSKVRQGIDGFPMLIFWNNTATSTTTFIGKYNFNNDKSTAEVFGFASPDESWETLNNASDRVLYKSGDFSGSGWKSDFEARYPDTDPAYEDVAQLAEFATWAASTDTTAATGNALAESVTYDGVTYTVDSAEYRLAKFKAEAGNYMEMQSALFYYLFTELFLMVDSRAKNAFPSFIGSEVTA